MRELKNVGVIRLSREHRPPTGLGRSALVCLGRIGVVGASMICRAPSGRGSICWVMLVESVFFSISTGADPACVGPPKKSWEEITAWQGRVALGLEPCITAPSYWPTTWGAFPNSEIPEHGKRVPWW
jgi:hypothetical protein